MGEDSSRKTETGLVSCDPVPARTSIMLPGAMIKNIEVLCAIRGRTRSEYIEDLIRQDFKSKGLLDPNVNPIHHDWTVLRNKF